MEFGDWSYVVTIEADTFDVRSAAALALEAITHEDESPAPIPVWWVLVAPVTAVVAVPFLKPKKPNEVRDIP
jgi:hypothetical protein